ncbi:MAG TPA: FtsX-like permease family protein [Steroidobacteraceae bacterium]|nr:FtsX-like permease family protein [Steroidobacteraceae bacterium]
MDLRLFAAIVWLPLRAHLGRTVLTVLAIGLGIALGLSIHLMNKSAMTEMSRATRGLYGQADLIVQGASGFDESFYPTIARVPGVAAANPVLEVRAQVVGHRESILLLGVDLLRMSSFHAGQSASPRGRDGLAFFNQNSILLSRDAADTYGVSIGDSLKVQVGTRGVEFAVLGILPSGAYGQRVALLDIGVAQHLLERLGMLTRVDLRLVDSDSSIVIARLKDLLPEDVEITTPAIESQEPMRLSRAFRVNVTALALVALFTGAFLVYSTLSLWVMRRRRELALLHALGTTPRQQHLSIIWTGVLLGAAGAAIGVLAGAAIAKFALREFLSQVLSSASPAPIGIRWYEAVGFAALGIVVAIVGSLVPAIEAAKIPTANALKSGNIDLQPPEGHHRWAFVLFAAAVPLLFAPPVFELPMFGYLAIAFILIGAVLCMPSLTHGVLAHVPVPRASISLIAVSYLRAATQSASRSAAAILVSVSLMVAMAVMVTSLRGSFADLLTQMFPGDLQVQAGMSNSSSYLESESIDRLRSVAGVERVTLSRLVPVRLSRDSMPVTLIARSTAPDDRNAGLPIEARAIRNASPGTIPIWISVAIADRYRLGPDQTFTFYIQNRPVTGYVRGIWRDFLYQQSGALMMDYSQYQSLTGDDRANTAAVWISGSASVDIVRSAVRESFGSRSLEIGLPGEYRERALRGFDSVFAITYLLLIVAVLLGLFAISINASSQVLARRSEFGVLRHIGFTRAQIAGVVGAEGLCLGLVGVGAGFLVGGCISAILIFVVGRQSFHWTMDLHVPVMLLAIIFFSVPMTAALAAIWSGRGAMAADAVQSVKEDW